MSPPPPPSLSLSLSLSLVPANGSGRDPSSPPTDLADFELPSYDDIVEDEPVLDENERIARQEEEDARIAKELFEQEQQSTLAEVSTASSGDLHRLLFSFCLFLEQLCYRDGVKVWVGHLGGCSWRCLF